jgi:hypothetical protein
MGTMSRHIHSIGSVIFLLLSGCSATTWQDSKDITPITYESHELTIDRTIGKLRRLALALATALLLIFLSRSVWQDYRALAWAPELFTK